LRSLESVRCHSCDVRWYALRRTANSSGVTDNRLYLDLCNLADISSLMTCNVIWRIPISCLRRDAVVVAAFINPIISTKRVGLEDNLVNFKKFKPHPTSAGIVQPA